MAYIPGFGAGDRSCDVAVTVINTGRLLYAASGISFQSSHTPIVYSVITKSLPVGEDITTLLVPQIQGIQSANNIYLDSNTGESYQCADSYHTLKAKDSLQSDFQADGTKPFLSTCFGGNFSPGFYRIRYEFKGKGMSFANPTSHFYPTYSENPAIVNTPYNLMVLPRITGLSASTGTEISNIIEIHGEGFSTALKNNTVTISGGQQLAITSAMSTLIQVRAGTVSLILSATSYTGGPGLVHEYWINIPEFCYDFDILSCSFLEQNAKLAGWANSTEQYFAYSSTQNFHRYYAWFTPPVDGSYVFRATSHSALFVFLVASDRKLPIEDPGNINVLLNISGSTGYSEWYSAEFSSEQESSAISLEKSKKYYLKIRYNEVSKEDSNFFRVGIEFKNPFNVLSHTLTTFEGWDLIVSSDPIREVYQVSISISSSSTETCGWQLQHIILLATIALLKISQIPPIFPFLQAALIFKTFSKI